MSDAIRGMASSKREEWYSYIKSPAETNAEIRLSTFAGRERKQFETQGAVQHVISASANQTRVGYVRDPERVSAIQLLVEDRSAPANGDKTSHIALASGSLHQARTRGKPVARKDLLRSPFHEEAPTNVRFISGEHEQGRALENRQG